MDRLDDAIKRLIKMCQSYIVISLCTLLTSYYFTQFLEATRTFFSWNMTFLCQHFRVLYGW